MGPLSPIRSPESLRYGGNSRPISPSPSPSGARSLRSPMSPGAGVGVAVGGMTPSGSWGSLNSVVGEDLAGVAGGVAAGANDKRRAIFCDVVVEGMFQDQDGEWNLPDRISSLRLLHQFGTYVPPPNTSLSVRPPLQPAASSSSSAPNGSSNGNHQPGRRRKREDLIELKSRVLELLDTEKNYVKKLGVLVEKYANPLRSYARSKHTVIIPAFEANQIFGNVKDLRTVHESFLAELEEKLERASGRVGWDCEQDANNWAEVLVKHLRFFVAPYGTYLTNIEKAKETELKMAAKLRVFSDYIERTKASTPGIGNVGLRELLMEPVQRIPRYKLLFEGILKDMRADDPNRAHLQEAIQLASKIALCETDEGLRRAAMMWGLERAIEGFPAALISSNRCFIDCIDVEDLLIEQPSPDPRTLSVTSPSPTSLPSTAIYSSAAPLHCTIFLFSDKILIAKRPGSSNSASGRNLAGLDDVDNLARTMKMNGGAAGLSAGPSLSNGMPMTPGKMKKGSMKFKGLVDLLDVVGNDLGGKEGFTLWFDKPPRGTSDRWDARPLRHFIVVPTSHTSSSASLRSEKGRFLENLWKAQALARAKDGRSTVFVSEERVGGSGMLGTGMGIGGSPSARGETVGAKAAMGEIVMSYWSLFEKKSYLAESRKGKAVLQLDETGASDELSFGFEGGPHMIARVVVQDESNCSLNARFRGEPDPPEERVEVADIPSTIVDLICSFGLYDVVPRSTPNNSTRPVTPNANRRSAILGSLFGTGGSVTGSHKRTRSATSKTSTSVSRASLFSNVNSYISTAPTSLVDEDSIGPGGKAGLRRQRSPVWYSGGPGAARSRSTTEIDRVLETPFEDDEIEILGSDERSRRARGDSASSNEGDDSFRVMRANSMEPPGSADIKKDSINRRRSLSQPPPIRPEHLEDSPDVFQSPETSGYRTAPTTVVKGPPVHRGHLMGPRELGSPPNSRSPNHGRMHSFTTMESPEVSAMSKPQPNKSETVDRTASLVVRDRPLSTLNEDREQRQGLSPKAAGKRPMSDELEQSPSLNIRSSKKKPLLVNGSPDQSLSRSPSPLNLMRGPARGNSALRRSQRRSVSDSEPASRSGLEERVRLQVELANAEASTSRKKAEQLEGEVQALRHNLARELAQKEVIKRSGVTENSGGLPRSPRKMELNFGSLPSAQELNRQMASKDAVDLPSLERWTNEVEDTIKGLKDQWVEVEGKTGEMKKDISELVDRYAEKEDEVTRLTEEVTDLRHQRSELDVMLKEVQAENEELYHAFNQELDHMYEDAQLPESQAVQNIQENLKQAVMKRNEFRLETEQLRRELRKQALERQEWERILREHNLIP